MITMERPKRSDRWGLPFITGHLVTLKHFLKNIFWKRAVATIEYPDKRRQYSNRFRGRHWLRTREDGSVACVACYMCSTNCPAQCIRIEAEEEEALPQEKRPAVFEIDLLRCVYCGFCVDACPCNVIYMTRDDELAVLTRKEGILTLEDLVKMPEKKGFEGDMLGYRPYEGEFPEGRDGIRRMKY